MRDSTNDELFPSKSEQDKPTSDQSPRVQAAKMTAHPKNTSVRRFALGMSRDSKPSTSSSTSSVAGKSYITPPNQWIPRAGTIKDPKRKSIRFQDPIEGIVYI